MKELIERAASKIERLRRQNEILQAKVDMIDLFATVLFTQPTHQRTGEEIDIVWELREKLEQMDKEELPEAE